MSRRDQPDRAWQQHVLNSVLPRMEQATGTTPVTGLTPATAADFGPQTFYADQTPNDPEVLLDGLPLAKMTALRQRALDLHSAIPTFDEISAVRLAKTGHANRIAHLTLDKSSGGFGLPSSAPQCVAERKKLERVEQELVRQETLREIRTQRWNIIGALARDVADWVMRGIPANCVIEAVEDAPLSELLKKGETISDGVSRYQLRLRELGADLHRVRSSPWPSSVAKAAALLTIEQLADQGAPNFDAAIEHNMPISFAQTTLRSIVSNAAAGAVAHAEIPDSIGLMCWLWRDELIAKINAGLDEAADDKAALSQAQREEMEAQISGDMLATERAECALIWIADARGEIFDFRSTTTPMAAIGVQLRNVPRASQGPSTSPLAYDLVHPQGRR